MGRLDIEMWRISGIRGNEMVGCGEIGQWDVGKLESEIWETRYLDMQREFTKVVMKGFLEEKAFEQRPNNEKLHPAI